MMLRRGQGFVELLIAIAVLMMSAVATVTLIFATLGAAEVSKSQVLAVNLGREGIEIVRAIRDSNWLAADAGVVDGLGDPIRFDAGLSEVPNPVFPSVLDHSAVPSFNFTTNAWSLDFSPNEADYTARSDATAVYFDGRRTIIDDTSGFYTQGAGAAFLPPFEKTNYWRLLSLYPICWDTTAPKPEETEEVIRFDVSDVSCEDVMAVGEVVGVEVHSRMQWMEKGRLHNFELVDKLFDWKV